MAKAKAEVLAWLDEQGWPHDPKAQSEQQTMRMRSELDICGARTRQQQPCTQPPGDSGRCRFHGDKSPRGIASPHYKNGKHSRYHPERLVKAAERAINDPQLLNLERDLVDVETRIDELKRRLDKSGDPGEIWAELSEEWAGFWRALNAGDRNGMERARNRINDLLQKQSHEYETWEQLLELYDRRRRLVATEAKRRKDERTTMTAEEATRHYMALALAVKKLVKDPEVLSEIAEEFIRITGVPTLPGAQAD